MGIVEWLLVAFLVIYCGYGASHLANRPDKTSPRARAAREARAKAAAESGKTPAAAPTVEPERRPSLLVSAWNASGARRIESTRFASAVAELTGRAIGSKIRARKARATKQTSDRVEAAQAAVRLGQTIAAAALRRWEKRADRSPVWRRTDKPSAEPAATDSRPDAEKPGPDEPMTATVECGHCGRKHTLTIKPGEIIAWTKCPCGAEQIISRRPLDVPPESESSTSSTDSTTETEKKENPIMSIPAQRIAAPAPTANSTATDLTAMAPPDWAVISQRVASFEPESDADLINFMTGEVAGICGYAESYEELHRHCIEKVGLDPRAVQGLGEFSEHVLELTQRMTAAHEMFLTAYQEVMQAVASGVVLPYNGRFFTGN